MILNHLNLPVTSPLQAQEFLVKYFELKPLAKGNDQIAFLTDEAGMILTLTNVKLGHETEARYPANFHIGFAQTNREAVNQINERLKFDGFDVDPPSKQHGSWTFYFTAPGGFTVEVLGGLQ